MQIHINDLLLYTMTKSACCEHQNKHGYNFGLGGEAYHLCLLKILKTFTLNVDEFTLNMSDIIPQFYLMMFNN